MIKSMKILFLLFSLGVVFFAHQHAGATSITLLPATSSVSLGETFNINISANIAPEDAIIGFGFDLRFSGSGGLLFNGFTPNAPTFGIDPFLALLSDSDGILGASGGDLFTGPPVSGQDILLGALSFTSTGYGNIVVSLTADDLDVFFTEGLIPADLNLTNFMPPVPSASVDVVPEPASMLLLGSGLIALAAYGRRKFFKK